jgi:FkbM family methyltransferase
MSLQRFLEVVAEEKEISEALSLFDDDRSRQIYMNLVNAKVTLDTKYIQEAYCGYERYYQYFDEEIVQLTESEVFVDGGGLDGNTSLTFVAKTKNKFKKIYIFEPNNDSYDLASQLPKFLNDDRIQVFEKGLLDSFETISFNITGEAGGCHIDFKGESTCKIETVALDQFIDDEVTFIKLDIEGSEERALFGAKNIIKKYNPKLAICVYHKFDDLWKLPILINKLNPKYKLYIRHYTNELNKWLETPLLETVCYAIPK